LGAALAALLPALPASAAFDLGDEILLDAEFPGTAVARMNAIRERARSLSRTELSGDWQDVRRRLLWAAGMKDLPLAMPGQGFTGHAFNDAIHVDATAMLGEAADNLNPAGTGRVAGIAAGNRLGPSIQLASVPELGSGGSWSTCQLDTRRGTLDDVAHGQFRARIAFKLVWCTPDFSSFVLVDDDGKPLARGAPRGDLPPLSERRINYEMVRGSKYAKYASNPGAVLGVRG
jgi:hypothetical protein